MGLSIPLPRNKAYGSDMDVLFASLLIGIVTFYMYKTQKNRKRFKQETEKLLQGDGVKEKSYWKGLQSRKLQEAGG